MNIRLSEDYQLTSDKYQYILQERKIPEKGKEKGKERWDNVGYYSRLNTALESYIDMRVKGSDKQSVADLLRHLKEITKEVKALVEVE
jgi:hypothetical protein